MTWTAGQLETALRDRYKPPEWAFLPQVANATGSHRSRTADGVAMQLWPSRGLELHGFEIKVSRSDWLRELENPAKAEAVASHCHRWWIVAGDQDIVKTVEMPAKWGLLVPRGALLHTAAVAGELQPAPLSYGFLAALLRRAQESVVPKEAIEQAVAAAVARAAAEAKRLESQAVRDQENKCKKLEETVRRFEQASGIKIDLWEGARQGEALAILMEFPSLPALRGHLGRLAKDAETAAQNLAKYALHLGHLESKVEAVHGAAHDKLSPT